MKFEIKSWLTGAIVFTAEIECSEDTPMSIKLGLAVKKAVEAKASLRSANLRSANLRSADLRSANLRYADLRSADLSYANLRSADLRSANLRSANLRYADLRSANLSSADLRSANLSSADLRSADLSSADLSYADLSYAVSLLVDAGNNRHIKTIQAGDYIVNYTDTIMQIGCQKHDIADWWNFDDAKIAAMDGKTALKFWRSWKPILQAVIAASPAEPTGYVEPAAEPVAETAAE